MAVMAQWGEMVFEISAKSLTPLTNFRTGFKIKNEETTDTSGTPPTNTTGRDTEQITFTVTYSGFDGSDVRRRFGAWRALIGKVNIFYLGGEPFGAQNFQLESADLSACEIDSNGKMIYAEVSITLTEYVKQTNKSTSSGSTTATTTTKNAATAKTAAAAYSRSAAAEPVQITEKSAEATAQSKAAAMSARPSSEEKARVWGK